MNGAGGVPLSIIQEAACLLRGAVPQRKRSFGKDPAGKMLGEAREQRTEIERKGVGLGGGGVFCSGEEGHAFPRGEEGGHTFFGRYVQI